MRKRASNTQDPIPSLRSAYNIRRRIQQILRGVLLISGILILAGLTWISTRYMFKPRRDSASGVVVATPTTAPTFTATPRRAAVVKTAVPSKTVVPTSRVTITPSATPLPKAEVWLAEGCNGTYAIGETVLVKYRADVDDEIYLWNYASDRSRPTLFLTNTVAAGKIYTASATFVEPARGAERLVADLGAKPADSVECVYTVTQKAAVSATPPRATLSPITAPSPTAEAKVEVWLVEGCDRAYAVGSRVHLRYRANVEGVVEIWDYPHGAPGELFLQRAVEAGIMYKQEVKIVPPVGVEERIVARLKDTNVWAECRFAVLAQ